MGILKRTFYKDLTGIAVILYMKELVFFEFPPPKTYYAHNMIVQQRNKKII